MFLIEIRSSDYYFTIPYVLLVLYCNEFDCNIVILFTPTLQLQLPSQSHSNLFMKAKGYIKLGKWDYGQSYECGSLLYPVHGSISCERVPDS